MSFDLYIRYVIRLLILVPFAVIAIMPVYESRKEKAHYLYVLMTVLTATAVVGGGSVCAIWDLPSNVVIIPALVIMFPLYCLCFNLSVTKKLFCFANAVLLCGFSTTYTTFLTAPLELENTHNVYTIVSGLICLGVTTAIGAVFAHFLVVKFPQLLENSALNPMWKVLDTAPVITAAAVIWMNPVSAENVMTGRLRPICLVVLLSIPVLSLFLYQIFWWVAKKMAESADLQHSYDLLRMEEKQYQVTYRYLMDIKEMRHDFRQHLLIIDEFAKTKQTDKLQEYIAPLMQSIEKKPRQICDNQAVNAIVSHYDTLASEQNVRVLWGIHLEEDLPVSEADICRVIGNLLENAIHAVSGLQKEDKVIDLRAGMIEDDTLAIHISNPFEGTITLDKDGFPVAENKNHGTGLRSVKSAAEKYGGEVIILTKNEKFEVDVLMYTTSQSKK